MYQFFIIDHDHTLIVVFQGFLRMFGVGYVVQAGVKSLSAVTHIFKKPGKVLQALKHKDNFGLALFLGTYTGLFRVGCDQKNMWPYDIIPYIPIFV